MGWLVVVFMHKWMGEWLGGWLGKLIGWWMSEWMYRLPRIVKLLKTINEVIKLSII